ncbi:hypothetical protein HDV57DRAFT_338021 [Trichoderma longibrachiatum]|uniref:Uncharacterized protein n=1 Tax=Trichoderma longibrachiatum ATCC 18648 TaxID=983965 RepID=A0A2T4BYG8_TRILO|nr:hypothetical protein M440DRAFT_1432488 [Trichoderma longibrachiatum ATCC 18648]
MSAPNGSSRTTRSSGLATASSSTSSTPANNGNKTGLFRNHFMKRPNASAAAAATTTPAAPASSAHDPENMRMDVDMQQQRQQQRRDASSDLVVRDKNGDAEVANPPALVVDDEDELQALEMQEENEREKQRLAEAIRLYRMSHSSRAHHPTEALLEAVRESNRNKVSALAEDNWMFEAEEQPRLA